LYFGTANSTNNVAQLGFCNVGNGSTSNYAFLQIYGKATIMTWQAASGYVGIGTTSPSGPLHINNTTADYTNSLIVNTAWPSIRLGNGSTGRDWSILNGGTGAGIGVGNLGIYDITASAYRFCINSSGQVGIGTQTPGYTLHVVGAIFATGNITAYSDQRYKQNIIRLDHSLDAIRSLSGYSYTRLDYLPGVRQIGLLAQEVKAVLPEAVSYDSTNDIYSVNYNCLMAPVVEAIKELYDRSEAQASIIQAQQLTIQKLMERLESL
jgi:hypothetical protein